MSSTSEASSSQYLHQVVQNSKRTILPLIESLLNCSPVVVLARKRGAGWPVSSAARAHIGSSRMHSRQEESRRRECMARNISQVTLEADSRIHCGAGLGAAEGGGALGAAGGTPALRA